MCREDESALPSPELAGTVGPAADHVAPRRRWAGTWVQPAQPLVCLDGSEPGATACQALPTGIGLEATAPDALAWTPVGTLGATPSQLSTLRVGTEVAGSCTAEDTQLLTPDVEAGQWPLPAPLASTDTLPYPVADATAPQAPRAGAPPRPPPQAILPAPPRGEAVAAVASQQRASRGWTFDLAAPIRRLSSGSSQGEHPLRAHPTLLDNIRLLKASVFTGLTCPMPRSQDLPESAFGYPSSSDIVVSVSHAWRNQTHPDPNGSKHKLICELLSEERLDEEGLYLFIDWTSIPQLPFKPNQKHRSPEEAKQFAMALECMHKMYFYADRIIHLASQDEFIENEGLEYSISAAELEGARFAQIGDWVQITEDNRAEAASSSHLFTLQSESPLVDAALRLVWLDKGTTWHLFDRVISVDGEDVTGTDHLQTLLSQPDAASKQVRLCCCPFGRVNDIPTDCRGWVFLERFITMVKCAMLDELVASKVVVTNSEAILEQILAGASRLRDAARLDETHTASSTSTHLERVLQEFLQELETKQFAATSTDKLVLDKMAESKRLSQTSSEPPTDRETVAGIMATFVESLCEHWQPLAKKQRRREKRLGKILKVAQAYLLEWDRFSDRYMDELAAANARDPAILFLLVFPPSAALVFSVLPFSRPDEGRQLVDPLIWFAQSWGSFLCHNAFPQFLAAVAGVQRDFTVNLRLQAWTLVTAPTNAAVRAFAAWLWGVYPLPMSSPLAAMWCAVCLPLLWLCISVRQRADGAFRKRAVCAFLSLLAILGLFAIGFPLVNVAMVKLEAGAQASLVPVYLVIKLGFEKLGSVFATYLGADVMPCFMFAGSYFFEFNILIGLAGGFHPFVFAELTIFNVAENIYHLWSLARQEARRRTQGEAASTEARFVQYYIVSQLILRQFVQLTAPAQFLMAIIPTRKIRPEFIGIVCELSDDAFNALVFMVSLRVCVQLVNGAATAVFLRRYSFRPLQILQGLLATHRQAILGLAAVGTAYFLSLQHAHLGNDLTFKFLWTRRGANARWKCGLHWIPTSTDAL